MADHDDVAEAYARELDYAKTQGKSTKEIEAAAKAHGTVRPEFAEYLAASAVQHEHEAAAAPDVDAIETATPPAAKRGRRR